MNRLLMSAAAVGVLALAACSGPAAEATTVTLKAEGLKFSPATMEVTAGQPVTLILENADTVEHDFSIMEIPLVMQTTVDQMAGHDMDHMSVDPQLHMVAALGQTSTMQFTPTKPGVYEFFCSVPGHKEAGMTGTLTVNSP